MSARRSTVEQDARVIAARDLRITREVRRDESAVDVLTTSANDLAHEAALLLMAGNVPKARRYARAHQLVTESRDRLSARHTREYDAKLAREAAEHGITVGNVVRVTGARYGNSVPVGTVCTIDAVSGGLLWSTIDGERRVVWASDVERVDEPAVEAPMPHDDEHGRDVAQEPAYGDRILAIGLWSDAEAFALAGAANAAAAAGRDPGQAVEDLAQSWDAGEVPA
jgi:hypothetical protein